MEKIVLCERISMKDLIRKNNLVIAGPCSAENEDQVIRTARELKDTGKVDILRAGIWKPRTNPGGFEGAGVKGLSWLFKVKQLTGLPTAVEVATTKHVEDALSFDTDVLWIGARTTVNPFSIQNIADALRGTDHTILIKNPINPDIKLWIGAVERFQKAGIGNIGLIHRGFSSYGNSEYRNVPLWQIPIEMKRLFPDLPMICDPSHICGKRDNLAEISQKSIDLAYSGLIIESHFNPEIALTDKSQQVTPEGLVALLEYLKRKTLTTNKKNFLNELNQLRDQIDCFDDELLALIANRMRAARRIGEIKVQNNVTVLQTERWNNIVDRMQLKSGSIGLNGEFIANYMNTIHLESIRIQESILKNEKN
jgi:chorismate mutase